MSKVSAQGFDEEDDDKDSSASHPVNGGQDASVLKQALTKSSTGSGVLKDGWMKKKRGD